MNDYEQMPVSSTKLPPLQLQYVYASDIDMIRFNAWVSTLPGLELHCWQDNKQLLIPYHIYDMWWRFEQDAALLTKLREIIPV